MTSIRIIPLWEPKICTHALLGIVQLLFGMDRNGKLCYHGLKDMLKSRYLRSETKGKLCNTMRNPIHIYGSKSWNLTRGDEKWQNRRDESTEENVWASYRKGRMVN
jgi:hypothetical protein